MKILLITNSEDVSADYFCSKIENVFRFNTDLLFTKYYLVRTNTTWLISNRETADSITSEDIIGGYYRRPTVPLIEQPLSDIEFSNALRQESYEIYQTIIESIQCKWLCDPNLVRIAESRILQLQYAKEVGFSVPDYIFSNNENNIKNFISLNNPSCMKTVQMGPFLYEGSNRCFYNTIIQENDVSDLSGIPIQIQRYIQKEDEYRVIIVGKEIFCVKIDSQERDTTKFDWRVNNCLDVKYTKAFLDKNVSDKCFQLLARFNINFASMDIIHSTDGNYYFLDLNPNGQWVWLDEILNLNICNSIKRFFYA